VKRTITLLLLVFLLLPVTARAQEGPVFSTMQVDLWPEYDHPHMLVIYKATLGPEVALPVELTLRMPAAAEKPHAVAVGPSLESVGDINYTLAANGEWLLVSFIATMPVIQFEYYDPGLQKNGPARQFVYRWPGDYAVSSLTVQVQQPLDATDMHIVPSIGAGAPLPDGLVYYSAEVGSLAAGTPFIINLDYQKPTDTLSAERIQVQPSAPLTPETTGRPDLQRVLPWMVALASLLLIAGGGWWYWQAGREEPAVQTRRRRAPRSMEAEMTPTEGVYCHQCGKRASAGDRFCRSCGTRLRPE
jgi:hypothetical protein